MNRLGRGTPAGGLAPVLARGHTAARRLRSALRRRFRPAPGARRPDPSLLRALRRPRRLPGPVRRQLRAAETWPLPADAPLRSWLAATADAHGSHRRLVDASGGAPKAGTVTVVCATARPENLERLLANHCRLRGEPRLVVVTNSRRFDRAAVEARVGTIPGAVVLHVDEDEPLGACLNAGLDRVTTRFAAKLDDDDWYGEHHLQDLLRAQWASGAAVTGRHTHFAWLADRDEVVLRFPGREMAYTSFVAGGTLLLDLEQLDGIRFPARTVGEDKGLLDAVLASGRSVFSADRFGYVQHRTGENTWRPGDAYLRRTVAVDADQAWGRFDR